MLKIHWGELSPDIFLKQYWQKQPLLLKQALPNFSGPLDANELAGLAMEAEIESRIISHNGKHNDWQVAQGPFEDFQYLGEHNWTLTVQSANNYSRACHELLNLTDFIPKWRLDDVMVSFATTNGTVGRHFDQFDVFIFKVKVNVVGK